MLVYGKQTVLHLIEHHSDKIETLYLAREIEPRRFSEWTRRGLAIRRIPPEAAQAMSKSGNHQGYLADVTEIAPVELRSLTKEPFVVVLCGVTDMGNIGALVRSAHALGVGGMIVTGIRQLATANVARSSSGALFDLPINVTTNLYDVMTELKNADFTLYGAVIGGKDVREMSFSPKRALLLGSEDTGITARAIARLDHAISIAMAHGFDSLNVSAAGAILMDRLRG